MPENHQIGHRVRHQENRFQNQDPVHGAHFLFRRLPFLPQRPQTLPQVLIRQPGHEITQEGTGSPRRRGHNKDFHGFLPLQKIVRFHALAVNVQDPLRGHFGFVVLEILVILAIDFVGVNIGQDLLKMFLTVPGAVFYFVPEPQDPVTAVYGLLLSVRLLLGSICGGLIGLEREMKGRPAGLKTFSLVCMGATLVMVTNEFIYVNVANSTGDSARMAAQVISGIGFLGAGTIMTTGNDRVKGLTTAAALWVTAAIGIAIGTGFYFGGIAGLIVLYLSSFTYRYIDAVIVARSRIMRIYVEGESEEFMLNLVGFFQKNEIRIISLVRKDENKWFLKDSAATIEMDLGRKRSHFEILDEIRRMKELRYIEEV